MQLSMGRECLQNFLFRASWVPYDKNSEGYQFPDHEWIQQKNQPEFLFVEIRKYPDG